MSKQNLIDTVSLETNTSKAEAGRMVDAVLHGLQSELAAGNKVSIVGFGSFSPVNRPARTVRNPQTGNAMEIDAKVVVKFKAGTKLLEAVN